MKNIYWFICLAVIGTGIAAITIYKKRHLYKVSVLIAFYLYMSGLTWFCEFIVLGAFNSYAYKTGVFDNIWAQNLLGHLLLNTTFYPSAAIVTVTSKRRKFFVIFYTVIFTLTEYSFIQLGLYEHHWWRYYMTILTVVILLIIAIKWFDRIIDKCVGLTRAVTFFFIALLVVHFPAPILLLLGKQYYQLKIINDFFGDLYLSSIIFIFTYHLLECAILAWITCILKKRYLKILPFIISIASQCIFAALHLMVLDYHWHLIYTLIIYEVFIGAFILIEKHTLKPT